MIDSSNSYRYKLFNTLKYVVLNLFFSINKQLKMLHCINIDNLMKWLPVRLVEVRLMVQVTFNGSNSYLWKFSISPWSKAAVLFFLYILKQIYSRYLKLPISWSSQSLELSPWSRYIHFIVFHSQSREVLIAYTHSPIKHVINTH